MQWCKTAVCKHNIKTSAITFTVMMFMKGMIVAPIFLLFPSKCSFKAMLAQTSLTGQN